MIVRFCNFASRRCLFLLITFFCTLASSAPATLLLQRPVDIAREKGGHDQWCGDLIDALVRFRIAALKDVWLVSVDSTKSVISGFGQSETSLPEDQYIRAATLLGAQYRLSQTFELTDNNKSISYFGEVFALDGNRTLATIERSFAVVDVGAGVDTCVMLICKSMGVTVPPALARFFSFSMVGNDPKTLREMGEICLQIVKSGDPIAQGDACFDLTNRDSRMELAYALGGEAYLKAGHYNKASQLFKSLYDIVPDYLPLYVPFARSLRLGKDLPSALAIARAGEGRDAASIPLLGEKALILDAMGRKAEMEKTYEQILGYNRKNIPALLFFARVNNERGRSNAALGYADSVLGIDKNNSAAWIEKGAAYSTLKKNDLATNAFTRAASSSTNDAYPLMKLGDLAASKPDWSAAAGWYEKAVARMPNDFDIHNKAANAWRMSGNIQKAATLLKSVEGRFSSNTILLKELGLCELQLGDPLNAQRHLESSLPKEQNDGRVLMALGSLYTGKGNFDDAFRMYNAAIPLCEDKKSCKLALAKLFLARRNPSQAQTYLSDIMGADPMYRGVNKTFADARVQANDPSQALAYYIKERTISGEDTAVQKPIVSLYYDAGNWQQVLVEGERLLKLDSANGPGLLRMGVAALRLKDGARAAGYVSRAMKSGKPDGALWLGLGQGYVLVNDLPKAINAFTQCLALIPRQEEALTGLADAYAQSGKDTLVAETYMRLFELNNAKYTSYLADAGHIYFGRNKLVEARQCYTRFYDHKYKDDAVNLNLASIEYGMKNYPRVIALLAEVPQQNIADEMHLMMMSECYLATGAYAGAIPYVTKALEMNPRNMRALEIAALAYEKTGNLLLASRMYEQYIALPSTDKHRDYAYHLAELYEKQGTLSQAIGQYEKNRELYRDDVRNYDRLAQIYMDQKSWFNAQTTLMRAVQLKDARPAVQKMLAQCYAAQKKNDDAIQWYQQYLTTAPVDSGAWLALGTVYYTQKEYKKAVGPLKSAQRLMPKNVECLAMLGRSLYETGDMAGALPVLSLVSDLKPTDIDIVQTFARTARARKDTMLQIVSLERWALLDPRAFDIRIGLGNIYLSQGKVDQAGIIVSAAIKIDPTNGSAYKLMARVYELRGDEGGRLSNLNLAAQSSGRDADIQYELGRLWQGKGDAVKAEGYFKSAVSLSTGHFKARFALGKIFLAQGRTTEAFGLFDEAAKLNPDDIEKHAYLAKTALLMGKQSLALGEADLAVASKGASESILLMCAQVYAGAAQPAKARELLAVALAANAKCIECAIATGNAFIVEANYKMAVKSFMSAWELGGYNETVVLALGRALSIDGKYLEARDFLSMVLARNSRNDRALYELCHVYVMEDHIAEAVKALEAFEKGGSKTGWSHLAQGEISEAQDQTEPAWISFSVAVGLLPNEPQVENACGRIYVARGQYDDAIIHFGKALAFDANNPMLMLSLAQAYEGQNNFKDALDICTNMVQTFADNAEVYYMIGRIKGKQNDHAGAIAALQQGISLNPRMGKLYNALGVELLVSDRNEEAASAFEKSVKLNPQRFMSAYRTLGDLYRLKLNQPGKARDAYQRYLKFGGDNAEVRNYLK